MIFVYTVLVTDMCIHGNGNIYLYSTYTDDTLVKLHLFWTGVVLQMTCW